MNQLSKLRTADLNLLVALRALLETRNVSRAAEELGLSQPAASHALNRLRDTFGDQLLVRSGRTMVATPKAELLLPKVRELLAGIESILDNEEEFSAPTSQRTFVIATNGFAAQRLVMPLVRAVSEEAPGANVHMVSLMDDNIRELLADGRVDLALLSMPMTSLPESLMMRLLFNDPFVTTVRAGHPFTKQAPDAKAFADALHILVSPKGDAVGAVDRGLAELGLRRRIVTVLPDYLVVPSLLRETDYVITTTRSIASILSEQSGLVQISPPPGLVDIRGGLYALWHERVQNDPASQWLRRLVLRVSEAVKE